MSTYRPNFGEMVCGHLAGDMRCRCQQLRSEISAIRDVNERLIRENESLSSSLKNELARIEKLETLIGDTQDFLSHLMAGIKSQYYYNGKLMANGMQHAKELQEHLKKSLLSDCDKEQG